ncbi:hypothetical protein BDU57DRAFT_519745 [Ampelomyces quisqualis]|uniref:Uncharacterized protein n=1 Tax=Ampelomyces quisqualis TaxID=50730 RepID=A0A6A5QKN6_AMPQU|nr:hypothetical protein BDU57DRAFT_519745 [Ampelomyces quisqualis]
MRGRVGLSAAHTTSLPIGCAFGVCGYLHVSNKRTEDSEAGSQVCGCFGWVARVD